MLDVEHTNKQMYPALLDTILNFNINFIRRIALSCRSVVSNLLVTWDSVTESKNLCVTPPPAMKPQLTLLRILSMTSKL